MGLDDILGSILIVNFQHGLQDKIGGSDVEGNVELEVIEAVVTEVVVGEVVGFIGLF